MGSKMLSNEMRGKKSICLSSELLSENLTHLNSQKFHRTSISSFSHDSSKTRLQTAKLCGVLTSYLHLAT